MNYKEVFDPIFAKLGKWMDENSTKDHNDLLADERFEEVAEFFRSVCRYDPFSGNSFVWVGRWREGEIGHVIRNVYLEDANKSKHMEIHWRIFLLEELKFNLRSFSEDVFNSFFADKGFEGRLDRNLSLIGFENGVYDTVKNCFRDPKPEDLISLTTGYNYQPYNIEQSCKKVDKFMAEMIPDPETRTFVMKMMARSLFDLGHQQMPFFTGEKWAIDKFTSILSSGLGEYATDVSEPFLSKRTLDNGSNLPRKRARFGLVRPDNLNMTKVKEKKKKRGWNKISRSDSQIPKENIYTSDRKSKWNKGWWSESYHKKSQSKCEHKSKPKRQKLNIGIMKEVLSHDGYQEDHPHHRFSGLPIYLGTDYPEVPSQDYGTWKRVRPVKLANSSLPKFSGQDLIYSLIHHWIPYLYDRNEEWHAPDQVNREAWNWMQDCDYIYCFLWENYLLTDGKDEDEPIPKPIVAKELYTNFVAWYKEATTSMPLSRKRFMEGCHRFGAIMVKGRIINLALKVIEPLEDLNESDIFEEFLSRDPKPENLEPKSFDEEITEAILEIGIEI